MFIRPPPIRRLLAREVVAQAAVVACDADGQGKPVAFVIAQPGGPVTEAELIEPCRRGLPSVKRPRKLVFTDAYPATGKVRRVDLRQMAAAALSVL
jgi:acyl-coenzyme A synthetase/AMP-(fatty) acid ligase